MAVGTGVYRVTGRNEIFILENNKWRYVSTEAALFQAGYSWADVQVIPVEEWCPYEVGYPMPGGWADPSSYGYYPHSDWYVAACVVPTYTCPYCGATFGSQSDLDDHIATAHPPTFTCYYCGLFFGSQAELDSHIATAHPTGEWKATQIKAPYKIAWTFGTPTNANMRRLVEGGFNLIQMYDNYYRGTKAYRDEASRLAQKYQIGIMPFPNWANNPGGYEALLTERRDDPAIWGWHHEEPHMTGMSVAVLQTFYAYAKSKNPDWKIFIAHGDDEWSRHGYAVCGICDVFGTDIYPCTQSNPEGYLRGKITGLNYDSGTRLLIDNCGCEHVPVIMAWAYEQWNVSGGIRMQYDVWKETVNRGLPSGLAYYLASGFLPEWGGNPTLWNEIVAMNQQIGGQTGIIPRPDEVITEETIIHSCNVKIGYQVSSFAENNDALTCPNCGMALGIEGTRGSEWIVEVIEVITPHILTCAKCGSALELLVSSIGEKNTEQFCPVCGEPAD